MRKFTGPLSVAMVLANYKKHRNFARSVNLKVQELIIYFAARNLAKVHNKMLICTI